MDYTDRHHQADGDYNATTPDSPLLPAVYRLLTTPLGAWWRDPSFGSRLHELTREKALSRVGPLAVQYARQALARLQDQNREHYLTDLLISYRGPENSVLHLLIEARDRSGQALAYTFPVAL